MVIAAARIAVVVVLGVVGIAAGPGGAPAGPADASVRSALRRGGYPWYDAKSDSVQPVWPFGQWFWEWLDGLFGGMRAPSVGGFSLGELVVKGLVLLALALLLTVLIELWRRHRAIAGEPEPSSSTRLGAGRAEVLPEGVRPGTADPWAEALRCRERGDYARAIVCLFAHQLLALDRARRVRLSPGRTGRQLVRAIDDPELRGLVAPTLRLFEAVYYGHRAPSAEAFESVWSLALDFERCLAEGVAP